MSEVRKEKIVILVNEAEYFEIKHKAYTEFKSMSAFCREICLLKAGEKISK